MAKFSFIALSPDGTRVVGTEDAPSIGDVHRLLATRDLLPVDVKPKKSILQFEITKEKVKPRELMHFSRQLAVFVKAGIPIVSALEVIGSETTDKLFKPAIDDMVERLRGGSTFAATAAAHPEVFPSFYVGILRSAELTGNLDTVLTELGDYLERDTDARQKVISALMYPAVVLGMSMVTVVVLAVFVLPQFEDFFNGFNAKLPLPTRMLLSVTRFLTHWGLLLGVIVVVLGFATFTYLQSSKGRRRRDVMLLNMPVLGGILRHAIVERFCRIFSSMLTAGVAVPEALAVTGEATNNVIYQEGIAEARDAMLRGEGLAGPLAATDLFPTAARQMFRVGEDTGTLDEQMATAAQYLDRELDYKIKRFTTLFEPAVIIFVGVMVGFVAVALVSAMYGIYNQVQI